MPIENQNVPVKLTVGIDDKSDPKSLQTKLTVLQNASFQSPGQIQKRDGFTALTSPSAGVGLASFKNELLAMDGSNLYSYSQESSLQVSKGAMTSVQLSVSPVVRQITSQLQADEAYDATTGLKCFAWLSQTAVAGTKNIYYSVVDTVTGANLVFNGIVSASAVHVKVMKVGTNFVILYYTGSGPNPGFNFATISTATPTAISLNNLIIGTIGGDAVFDSVVVGSTLYVSYVSGASNLTVRSFNSSMVLQNVGATPVTAFASYISMTADGSGNIWVAMGNKAVAASNIVAVFSSACAVVLVATQFDTTHKVSNATLIVSGTTATIYGEVNQPATISGLNLSNYVNKYLMTIGGSLTAGTALMKGVGLAAKCFTYGGTNYNFVVYQGNYQITGADTAVYAPRSIQTTYFLINGAGKIVMKLAPFGAYGYNTQGMLPEVVNTSAGNYSFTYLFQENVTSVSGQIVFATGVMNANMKFVLSYPTPKVEYANNLHLGSGQLWAYDGQDIVEHGFHINPENVYKQALALSGGGIGTGASAQAGQVQYVAVYEWLDNYGQKHRSAPSIPITVNLFAKADLTPLTVVASTVAGTNTILGGYIPVGQFLGQVIEDTTNPTTFPVGTYITGFDASSGNITVSNPATASHVGDTISIFDVSSIQILIPTLRQTSKSNVSLVLYRTENNGTIFYRVTSPSNIQPYNGLIYNDPTVDYIIVTDNLPDQQLIGSEQLYTTGGVVENIAAPAITSLATFRNRLTYLSAENPFEWGYSQQVITGAPVEFNSLLFVQNVDQNIGRLMAHRVLDDKLIFFGPTSKWYVVGQGPSPTGANNDFTDATRIVGVAGCSNPASIVEIPDGLMFQDIEKGIYLLDRALGESYIGAEVEAYNGITITSAQKFEKQNKVVFTLSTGVNLIYDYYVKQWEVDPFSSAAVDSTVFQNKLTYIQANGLILQQNPAVFSDNNAVIPMQLESGWISFAGLVGFSRVLEFHILGTYYSPHTLTVTFYNDFSTTPSEVVTIPVLSDPGNYEFRMKLKVQKCTSIKFNITESQSVAGRGFSLSSVAFRVGAKKGLNKLPAGASY